jgi:hypothetical protein
VMAAFSIFFTQSASFLDQQRLMKSNKGKDNAESLFSIKKNLFSGNMSHLKK